MAHLSGSGGFLSPEQASPHEELMALPLLGKQGGADEWEGFFLSDFSLSIASSVFIHLNSECD